jgi:hypothetical protein
MKLWILTLLFPLLTYSQYKNNISVVQFSAEFVENAQVDLSQINDASIYTLLLSKEKKFFISEEVVYLPTVVLYHNKKEIIRIESGIGLTLPDNTLNLIQHEINKIKKRKF